MARASLLDPADEAADPAEVIEHAHAVGLLRQRYPQYETQRLEALPGIRIAVERVKEWRARREHRRCHRADHHRRRHLLRGTLRFLWRKRWRWSASRSAR
jgi:hypothetical protein